MARSQLGPQLGLGLGPSALAGGVGALSEPPEPIAPDLEADFGAGLYRIEDVPAADETAWLAALGGVKSGAVRTFGPRVTGPELLANGTFDVNVAGWSAATGWPANLTRQSNRLRNTYAGAGQTRFRAAADTEPGRPYRLGGSLIQRTSGAVVLAASASAALDDAVTVSMTPAPKSETLLFVATAATTYVGGRNTPGGAGLDEWDNFSLKAVAPLSDWDFGGLTLWITATTPASAAGTEVLFQMDADGEGDRVSLRRETDGRIILVVTAASAPQAALQLGTVGASTVFDARLSVAPGLFRARLNTGARVTASGGALPPGWMLRLGRGASGSAWTGTLGAVRLWKGARPEAVGLNLA